MSDEHEQDRQAWVALADADFARQVMAGSPYDFGFAPGMTRLIMAHGRIAAAFGQLFSEVMFSPDGVHTRAEREMVAGVASAAQDCFY